MDIVWLAVIAPVWIILAETLVRVRKLDGSGRRDVEV